MEPQLPELSAAGEAVLPPSLAQCQQVEGVPAAADDPSRVWLPELVQRFAGFLAGNEVACALRLVNKAAAAQFRRPQDRTVTLSQPVPHAEFVWRWGGADAMGSLTRQQRDDLPCLTASSGCIANLEVLLARSDAVEVLDWRVLDAAVAAGRLEVCRWLRRQGCPYGVKGPLRLAARKGDQVMCEWLLANGCPHDPDAASQAAHGGHVGLMDWLLGSDPDGSSRDINWVQSLLASVAWGCDLPILQRLHDTYLDSVGEGLFDDQMDCVVASAACSSTADWRAKVEWLEARGYPRTLVACTAVAERWDGLARLQWLRQRGYPLEAALTAKAGRCGDTDMLRYLLAEGVEVDQTHWRWAANGAAVMGHVAFLRALVLEHGRQAADFRGPTSSAAMWGRLPVVEALVEMLGAADVLTVGVFKYASRSGSMELLTWLHAHGCPWDQSVFARAAEFGSEEVVEWLAERGCPMGERGTAYQRATCRGNLPMLRCLRRVGCPWGPKGRIFTHAVGSFGTQHAMFVDPDEPVSPSATAAQLAALQWMLDEGCPVVWGEALRMARMQGRAGVLAWLKEQRQQQVGGPPAAADDPSRAWLPELVQRFAGFLSGNEVACALRLVNKAAAAQLNRPRDRTVLLSLAVPPREFKRRWGRADAMRRLNLSQRTDLPCLVARSGCIANLEVLLARSDAVEVLDWRVLDAAMDAGRLEVCRWLRRQGCPYSPFLPPLHSAARNGDQVMCEWLLADGCPHEPDAASQAARGGHVGLMDWLLGSDPSSSSSRDSGSVRSLLEGVAAGCDLPILQRLHHTYLDSVGEVLPNEHMGNVLASAACSNTADWRAKVEWLEGRGYPPTLDACTAVAGRRDGLARLQWLRQRGYPLQATLCEQIGGSGNIEALRYLLAEGVEIDPPQWRWAAQRAAVMGHVAFLRALVLEHGRQAADFRGPTSAAAMWGRLPVVEALVDMLGAADVLNVGVFNTASCSGSMELLAWLHAHGCPWDQSVFARAAEFGSEEVVEWLAERGCPMGERGTAYQRAACRGNLPMLRCLRRVRCPWGPKGRIFTHAVGSFGTHHAMLVDPDEPVSPSATAAHLDALQWMLDEGCPVVWGEALRMAWVQEREEVYDWLEEQREQQQEPEA